MGTMVTMSEDRRAEGQSEQSPWDMASGAFIAWRSGDASAMDELVATMTPVLWHVVRAYGHDRQTAEDVIQAIAAVLRKAVDGAGLPEEAD